MSCVGRCNLLATVAKRFCLGTGAQENDNNPQAQGNRCTRLNNLLSAWDCAAATPTCTPIGVRYRALPPVLLRRAAHPCCGGVRGCAERR